MTPLTWITCFWCRRLYVRSPARPDVFCQTSCRDAFEHERFLSDRCAFTGCTHFLTEPSQDRRKYCCDTCCATAYFERKGGPIVRRLNLHRGRHVIHEDPIAARIVLVAKDRERYLEAPPAARLPPPPHVTQNTYRPGLLAFELLYGQRSTGRTASAGIASGAARTYPHQSGGYY